MEVERPFIFVKQYPDGRVLLEMDPLQHYEISNIPDFSKTDDIGVRGML